MNSSQLPARSSLAEFGPDDESDEEIDWEEVSTHPIGAAPTGESVPNYNFETGEATPSNNNGTARNQNIEITLKKVKRVDPKKKKQGEQTAELRALRLTCHKIHTVALLANAIIRNRWINDPLLHARLLSLAPMSLQTSFSMITKKRHPEAAKRGRLFESAMMRLTQWWYEEFFVVENTGHVRSRTFDEVQKLLFEIDFEDDEGEVIRGSKSLMKHALKRCGSRDVSSQLFTALCRALDIPARLVVSLQSVPWQAAAGKPRPSGKKSSKKGKGKANISPDSDAQESALDNEADELDDDMEEVTIPRLLDGDEQDKSFPGERQTLSGASTPRTKGKEKELQQPTVKLRKSKSSGQKLGSKSSSRQGTPRIGGSLPVFWTEVFSRPDGKWMPVDPTRYIVNKRKVFEPSACDESNRMVYVVAVEEDGYCRDVTARYARDYGAKTSKVQLGGKGRKKWWESAMALVTRPYRLVRDDVEDEEFEYLKYTEGMPTSVVGFKNHPLYVLEQHLKREEVIFPKTEVGKFRGEPVYPRSNVIPLKTAENWMRGGRRVKEGAQALKWVKQRAMTIHRRRAMELAQQEGDEILQGLYSEDQTEPYVPDPVVDGIIPKNEFGNIDLYTSSMLPKGAAHIPYKGSAKVARKLGFDYAEAVTSFEFKKGRAFPILSGIVVASENEETLLEAYWEAEREAEAKELAKRRERVIKRWSRLIQGLRIRQRLQDQYAGGGEPSISGLRHDANETTTEIEQPGGFTTEADTVVQPFHLPRFEHSVYQPPSGVGTAAERDEVYDNITLNEQADALTDLQRSAAYSLGAHLAEEEDDDDHEEILPTTNGQIITSREGQPPKSMLDLAKESETRQTETNSNKFNGDRHEITTEIHKTGGSISDKYMTQRQRSNSSVVKVRQKKIGAGAKSSRRRRLHSQKRNGSRTASLTSPPETSDLSIRVASNDHDSDSDATGSRQRPGSSRSTSKRQRSSRVSAASSPTTRVLRTRVPKTTEQIVAQKESNS